MILKIMVKIILTTLNLSLKCQLISGEVKEVHGEDLNYMIILVASGNSLILVAYLNFTFAAAELFMHTKENLAVD